jgi:adenylate kinase
MKIALTGTPGVGKTAVASVLKEMGYEILRIIDIADDFVVGYDPERHSKIVDEKAMDNYIKHKRDKGILIIEGHLSHLISSEYVVLLRCHPELLKERLKHREWSEKKIMENVEAEALDIILQKALERNTQIWELDTSNRTPDTIANEIHNILKTMPPPNYGKIDWSEWMEDYAGQI